MEVATERSVTDGARAHLPDNGMVKIMPMLVIAGPLRPDSDRYVFEVKWDEFRGLIKGGGQAERRPQRVWQMPRNLNHGTIGSEERKGGCDGAL